MKKKLHERFLDFVNKLSAESLDSGESEEAWLDHLKDFGELIDEEIAAVEQSIKNNHETS